MLRVAGVFDRWRDCHGQLSTTSSKIPRSDVSRVDSAALQQLLRYALFSQLAVRLGTADGSLAGTHTWQKPQGDKQHENFR